MLFHRYKHKGQAKSKMRNLLVNLISLKVWPSVAQESKQRRHIQRKKRTSQLLFHLMFLNRRQLARNQSKFKSHPSLRQLPHLQSAPNQQISLKQPFPSKSMTRPTSSAAFSAILRAAWKRAPIEQRTWSQAFSRPSHQQATAREQHPRSKRRRRPVNLHTTSWMTIKRVIWKSKWCNTWYRRTGLWNRNSIQPMTRCSRPKGIRRKHKSPAQRTKTMFWLRRTNKSKPWRTKSSCSKDRMLATGAIRPCSIPKLSSLRYRSCLMSTRKIPSSWISHICTQPASTRRIRPWSSNSK